MRTRAELVVSCAVAVSWLCACGTDHQGLGASGGTSAAGTAGGAAGTAQVDASAAGSGGDTTAADAGAAGTTGSAGNSDAGSAPSDAAPFTYTAVASCSKDGWCWSTPAPQGNTLTAIRGSSASDVWAVGDSGTIIHFDGVSWKQVPSGEHDDLTGVWAAGPNEAWAVGNNDVVLHWNGTAWSSPPVRPATGFYWHAVWGTAADDVWIAGGNPSVQTQDGSGGVMMHWDGGAWTGYTASQSFGALWGTGPDDVWGAGEAYGLFHWNGKDWTTVLEKQAPQIGTGIWGSSSSDLWFTSRATLQPSHWDGATVVVDQGADPGQAGDFDGIWGTGASDIWAVGHPSYDWFGDGGLILHWNGLAWSKMPSTGASHLFDVWGSRADDVWAVGEAGDLVHWNGRTWSSPAGPPHVNLFSVWGSSSDDVWAFGFDKQGLGALRWNGQTWARTELVDDATIGTNQPASTAPYAAWGSGRDDIWVGAVNFNRIANTDSTTSRSLFVHWDGRAWSLDTSLDGQVSAALFINAMWGSGPNDVWAVGPSYSGDDLTGGAVHWDGVRWSRVTSLSAADRAQSFRSVWSSGPDDVWIGGDAALLHWNGVSWSRPLAASDGETYRVGGSGPKDVWAIKMASDGATVASQWNGVTWQHSVIAGVDGPSSIAAISPTNAWLRGDQAVAHWDGATWTRSDAGTNAFSSNLWWDGKALWTIALRGLIRHP